ncbi:hypothetical protein HKD37_20G055609 [Glycine soja]
MEADMEAMKEQMAAMMEAMMSMKKIMEANAIAIAVTSIVAKVNPTSPSGINESSNLRYADFEPCLGYATEGQAVGGIPLQNPLEGPRASEEDEDEGEARAVTAIPIQPSFPPTQQCHYSANNKPSPYPPPSYPQRPSLKSTTKPIYRTSNDKHHL